MPDSYFHLSLEERKTIESCLCIADITLKQIAAILNRSPKCVRYEVTRHRHISIRVNQHNKCGRQNSCDIRRLCTHCLSGLCRGCTHNNCNNMCSDFIDTPVCKRTNRFPYVCSGCQNIDKCRMPKYFYNAARANDNYIHDKTVWRQGPQKTAAEMKVIAEAITDGVKKRQSLDVIIHTRNLNIAPSTAYRYIRQHQIPGIINLDLKRQTRYTQRASNKPVITRIDYDWLKNREYETFLKRLEDIASVTPIWELDTLIGKKEGDEKCVCSLHHRASNFQFYFLIQSRTCLEINKVFDYIKKQLGCELFTKTFPIILTDNGSEFHDPLAIETDPVTGEKLCEVYFCHPRRSEEKGKCEKNHEHFREIIPKGLSMNPLSDKDVNYVSNMVNNYPRPMLSFHSPYEVASLFFEKKVFKLNKLKSIPAHLVELTPIIH